MKHRITLTIIVLSVFNSAFALGALYARRPGSSTDMQPLWLKEYHADVKVTDQIAVTHVDQTFRNESPQRLEGIFFFPLPENAIVTELALWINGERVVGDVMEKDTARAIYNAIVRRSIDPALLESMGDNIFKLSVFPIEPAGRAMSERRIEITYVELLPHEGGTVDYTFFMKTINMSSKAVSRASVSMDLTSERTFLSLESPDPSIGAQISIVRKDAHNYKVTYGNENAHSERDLTIQYRLQSDDYALHHLTYVPDPGEGMFFDSPGDDPYFLLWVTPPEDITTAEVIRKNLVFVADVSSSMEGERIVRLRNALKAMVDMLNPGDRFNILAFGTGVQPFAGDLTTTGPAASQQAHDFINGLAAGGLTNMEDALRAGLASAWDDTSVNALIFLTDGKPTWPMSSTTTTVLTAAAGSNTDSVSIHTFGVGQEVDNGFLTRLARENGGMDFQIAAEEDIDALLPSFMKRISYPLIRGIDVTYNNLKPYDVYPKVLPNLYAGTQLTLIGRYGQSGTHTVTFTGKQRDRTLTLAKDLPFPSGAESHPFIPRMWASWKIDWLLGEIAAYGEREEFVTQVKVLGRKYSIITPYTSMLVLEPGVSPPPDINTAIEDKTKPYAAKLKLFQNYPNPFRGTTTLRYAVPRQSSPCLVTLRIYDARGRMVKELVRERVLGGNYVVQWHARDSRGSRMAAGTYVAVLRMGETRKMIAMRMVR